MSKLNELQLREAQEGMDRCLKLAEEMTNPVFVEKFLVRAIVYEEKIANLRRQR